MARKRKSSEVPDGPLELAILAPGIPASVCRAVGSNELFLLETSAGIDAVSGEVVTVRPSSIRKRGKLRAVAGEVGPARLDAAALGLPKLRLQDQGPWDAEDNQWGDPPAPWEKAILDAGPRNMFEMELVVPGDDDLGGDGPILDAIELRDRGDYASADKLLLGLLALDLRCLDAHAHLGNFKFDLPDHDPAVSRYLLELARRHFAVGLAIGDLCLGPGFGGVLSWGFTENRPYMRCLHGLGLCEWRLGRHAQAAAIFERMLWLNPNDNSGARFLLAPAKSGQPWSPD